MRMLASRDLPQASFIRRMVTVSDAGGTSDVRIKPIIAFLQKYIPGNSRIAPVT